MFTQSRTVRDAKSRRRLRLGFELLEDRRVLAVETSPLRDINTAPSSSSPRGFVDVGGTVFFVATTRTTGDELWKSDGTASGTTLVKDIREGSAVRFPAI